MSHGFRVDSFIRSSPYGKFLNHTVWSSEFQQHRILNSQLDPESRDEYPLRGFGQECFGQRGRK